MADTEQQPLKTYRGNCHCGAFVYEMDLPEIKSVRECNCSMCRRRGYLWSFPGKDNFRVVRGAVDQLTSYTFGSKTMEHKFCGKCGTGVMGTAAGDNLPAGVNVHSIQGLNTWDLEKTPYDGKSERGTYDAPTHKGELPKEEVEGGKLYTGGCHCGKVTVAVNSKPLDETYEEFVAECNCSFCERGGYIWIYPKNEQIVLSGADEDIGRYAFARGILDKTFCKTCGVLLTNQFNPLAPIDETKLSEQEKAFMPMIMERHPVNLRVLEGLDLSKVKSTRSEGSNSGPAYVNP